MSKRSTRRLKPSSAKNATLPTASAASAFAEAPNSFASRESGVTIARSSSVTQAAIDMKPGTSAPRTASHSKFMPSGTPARLSTSVNAARAPAATAATAALLRRPASAAKKLVARSSVANAAAGAIDVYSAPRSRSHGTPRTQPQIAAAPSAATMP